MLVDRSELPEEFDLCAIDADILVYQCAFSAQKKIYHLYNEGELIHTEQSKKCMNAYIKEQEEFFLVDTTGYTIEPEVIIRSEVDAYDAVDSLVNYIKRKVKAKEYKLYLTDSKRNYRNSISVTRPYKGNRESLEKPFYYNEVKEYLQKEYGAYMVVGQEADDAVSVAGCLKGKKTCVATIDKDLKGSPITIYNFSEDEWYLIDEEEADRFFFTQCLTGDKTDNIEGLPNLAPKTRSKYGLGKGRGVGQKTAEKLLESCTGAQELYDRVSEAYKDYLGDTEGLKRLNEMGKLLWMQRKKGKVFDISWYERED